MERINWHFDFTPTSAGEPLLVNRFDPVPIGYTGYEFHIHATNPVSGATGDFGELTFVWNHTTSPGQTPEGGTSISWRGELDLGYIGEGPVRGPVLELYYTAPASNLSQVEIDVSFTMGQHVVLERGLPEDGLLLNAVFANVPATATNVSAYDHAALATGPATLVLAAPTRKGTFRIQLGGADFEDIPVAAGTTVRVPYILPRRSMSVRVTNTDVTAGSYSARLISNSTS